MYGLFVLHQTAETNVCRCFSRILARLSANIVVFTTFLGSLIADIVVFTGFLVVLSADIVGFATFLHPAVQISLFLLAF